ncbi:MAG: DUF177 domain-containing protein [Alistipes sp.]
MGIAKRYSIAYKGLKNGQHTFDFPVDGELFKAFECPEIKDGTCKVQVQLARSESMLEIDTLIDGSVVVACDRCLDDCDVPIHFEGRLVVKFSDEIDEYDGEVMWISPSASEVDLAQYIYESIVLSLPYQRVHPEGMCDPEMLARFKIVSDAEFAAIEARQRAENAAESSEEQSEEWKKLEALRVQLALDERDKNKE